MMYLLKIPLIGGIPVPEDPTCVKMPCISIPPENQFTYAWKMLIANKVSNRTPLCAEKCCMCLLHTPSKLYRLLGRLFPLLS